VTQSQQIRIYSYDWNIFVYQSKLYIFHAFRLAGRAWFRKFSANRHMLQERQT